MFNTSSLEVLPQASLSQTLAWSYTLHTRLLDPAFKRASLESCTVCNIGTSQEIEPTACCNSDIFCFSCSILRDTHCGRRVGKKLLLTHLFLSRCCTIRWSVHFHEVVEQLARSAELYAIVRVFPVPIRWLAFFAPSQNTQIWHQGTGFPQMQRTRREFRRQFAGSSEPLNPERNWSFPNSTVSSLFGWGILRRRGSIVGTGYLPSDCPVCNFCSFSLTFGHCTYHRTGSEGCMIYNATQQPHSRFHQHPRYIGNTHLSSWYSLLLCS